MVWLKYVIFAGASPGFLAEYFGNAIHVELFMLVIALVAVVRFIQPQAVVASLLLVAALDSGTHTNTDMSLFAVTTDARVTRLREIRSKSFDPAKALLPRIDATSIEDVGSNDAYLNKNFYLASYTHFRLKRLDGLLARGFRPFLLNGQRVVGFVAGSPPEDGNLFTRSAARVDFQIPSYLPSRVEYVVNLPVRTLLVFNEVYFPGWRARVDGKSVGRMAEAAGGLRALTVEAGRHTIVTRFLPAEFWIGLTLTLLSWILALAWLVRAMVRARKQPATVAPA